jgi:hypothetical protein
MTKDEALRLAFEALEEITRRNQSDHQAEIAEEAITAIKAALEAKDEPVIWGASSISKPEYIAEQKAKTKELRNMMDEAVQTVPNFDQLQQIVNNLERCLERDSKHEFLRVWIRDWTEHKLSKDTSAALEAKDEPVAWPCLIANADFDKETVTLVMQCSDYKVSAGMHWLLTTPPQRQWVGLTDEDRLELAAAQYGWEDLLFAAEAKLKAKNT